MGLSPWREDGSVVYNCCWPSQAQSFSGTSPVGRMTIFYCLRFDTSTTWRARSRIYIPEEQGGPVIPTGIECSSRLFLRLTGLRWRYPNLPPRGDVSCGAMCKIRRGVCKRVLSTYVALSHFRLNLWFPWSRIRSSRMERNSLRSWDKTGFVNSIYKRAFFPISL
jgi:hypothetical protein